jgi:DNA polymerase elongation subunit (family B)
MGSLINKKPLSIIDNCPKKITYENFRDIIFYKLNEYNFSIDIISNSPKESIQKCFETIFIEEFNKFYLNEIKKKIKIYSDINNIYQQYLNTFNNKNDNSKIIYEYNYNIQTRTLAINYLKNFNFIVDPNNLLCN